MNESVSLKSIIELSIYLPLYSFFAIKNKTLFHSIINRWFDVLPFNKSSSYLKNGIFLLSRLKEFRSILYFTFKIHKSNPICWFYKPQTNLYLPLNLNIGSGLVIQHGFSTIFNCEKMGDNCQVWQGVTIGKKTSGANSPRPVIGNNVKICANAVVIGGITIGDNVIIGAGAVVVKSIPPNSIVVGNPARIIKN